MLSIHPEVQHFVDKLQNGQNKQRKHERVLNLYCRPKIGKIHRIQQNMTRKPSASFVERTNREK